MDACPAVCGTMAQVSGWAAEHSRTVRTECCTLELPRMVGGVEQTLASVHAPPLEVARLVAYNTGGQGGYGQGDSIELTLRQPTDRAGFALGEVLERSTLDRLLVFSHSLGDDDRAYAAVWVTNCTLLLVAVPGMDRTHQPPCDPRAHQPWSPCDPRAHQPWSPCDPHAHQPWVPCDHCLTGQYVRRADATDRRIHAEVAR